MLMFLYRDSCRNIPFPWYSSWKQRSYLGLFNCCGIIGQEYRTRPRYVSTSTKDGGSSIPRAICIFNGSFKCWYPLEAITPCELVILVHWLRRYMHTDGMCPLSIASLKASGFPSIICSMRRNSSLLIIIAEESCRHIVSLTQLRDAKRAFRLSNGRPFG